MIIETKRLILREMRPSDAADLLEYQSNPEIVRYIPWPVGNPETVQRHIEKTLANSKSLPEEEGEYLVLVWELKESGKVIGQSNISIQSLEHRRGEVGWVTHQDFQRQGYAYEASLAMLNFGFEELNLHRIVAEMDTRVPASAAVAMKLGMRKEAEQREVEFFKGEWCDMWIYAILKSEFEAGNN
jgi:RimJ/RimL family protein N-acetyltransferase